MDINKQKTGYTFGIFAEDITQYMPADFVKVAGVVKQIYVSDMVPTYCCESTPSYYMEPLRIETENFIDPENPENGPEICNMVEECGAYSEGGYFHIRDAMRLPHELEIYPADESIEEQFSEFLEMHQCNHTFDTWGVS